MMINSVRGIGRRRALTITAVVAVSGIALAACSSGGSSQGSSGASSETSSGGAAAATTLTWANDAAWHKDGQDALSQAAQESLGISIDSTIFPTTEAFQEQVRSSINTSSAFPIFDWWFGYRMQDMAEASALTDITDLWDAAVADGEYSADLEKMVSWDGKAYGVPKLVNYWVVLYNKKVFADNDLQPPTTWAELETICSTLKAKGIYPFGLNMQDNSWESFIWFEEVLLRTDPALYQGVLDGTIPYNDPKVVQAVGTWVDFLKNGYITPTGLLTNDNQVAKFASGDYAMFLIGDWFGSSLDAGNLVSGTDYGAFAMPGITDEGNGALIVEVRPTVFAKNSKDAAAAKDFAKYFLGVDGATVWASASQTNSPNLKVSDDTRPAYLKDVANDVKAGKYALYERYWEGTPTPVVDAVYPLLGKIIENPDSAASALDEAQAAAKAAWPAK